MIIVTGGAGFIGSNLVKKLNSLGMRNILIVDKLKDSKLENISSLEFNDFIDVKKFHEKIDAGFDGMQADFVFHLGACSDTTEKDGKYLLENNYEFSKSLAHFCLRKNLRFVYASSASVYGLGLSGFKEKLSCEKPINLYAFTKWQFDQYIRNIQNEFKKGISGLRYFNVYGQGETHKGRMASPILKFKNQLEHNKECNLFKAYGGFNDGEHLRDFIYIDDVVDVTLWSMFDSFKSGIYNVGTSRPSTFNQIANTLIKKLGYGSINYIDFPDDLKNKYQPFTSADISQLRDAGYEKKFHSLEEGINKYLTYL